MACIKVYDRFSAFNMFLMYSGQECGQFYGHRKNNTKLNSFVEDILVINIILSASPVKEFL